MLQCSQCFQCRSAHNALNVHNAFNVVVLTMLSMLQCYYAAMPWCSWCFRCHYATMSQCYNAAMGQCDNALNATVLQCHSAHNAAVLGARKLLSATSLGRCDNVAMLLWVVPCCSFETLLCRKSFSVAAMSHSNTVTWYTDNMPNVWYTSMCIRTMWWCCYDTMWLCYYVTMLLHDATITWDKTTYLLPVYRCVSLRQSIMSLCCNIRNNIATWWCSYIEITYILVYLMLDELLCCHAVMWCAYSGSRLL